jgi:hypothetical protein
MTKSHFYNFNEDKEIFGNQLKTLWVSPRREWLGSSVTMS